MKVDYAARGSGKTTRCVLYAIKNDCILVVPTAMTKKFIEEKWHEAVIAGALKIQTINEYIRFKDLYKGKHIVIDNADWCLEILLGSKIDMISIDNESKVEKERVVGDYYLYI